MSQTATSCASQCVDGRCLGCEPINESRHDGFRKGKPTTKCDFDGPDNVTIYHVWRTNNEPRLYRSVKRHTSCTELWITVWWTWLIWVTRFKPICGPRPGGPRYYERHLLNLATRTWRIWLIWVISFGTWLGGPGYCEWYLLKLGDLYSLTPRLLCLMSFLMSDSWRNKNPSLLLLLWLWVIVLRQTEWTKYLTRLHSQQNHKRSAGLYRPFTGLVMQFLKNWTAAETQTRKCF